MAVVANAHGKICYVEIPAANVASSAEFYRAVFGWTIRMRGDGATAFDDGVEVSGAFVTGRPPADDPGFRIYVMVADAEATLRKVVDNGGIVVEPVHPNSPEIVARFRDPAGNLLGVYQERALGGPRA
jgi:predicted enzyme related to lactoylglutathione lyase